MPHAAVAPREPGGAPRGGAPAGPGGPNRRLRLKRSRAAHHRRRRRVLGLAVLALLVLALWIFGRASGVAPSTAGDSRLGFFGRIAALTTIVTHDVSSPVTAAEDRAIDRVLAYTPYVRIAGAQHRELALTFDDGPGPYTPAILDVLERHHVPATFFEVGMMDRYFHASTSQIVADGDIIGDHTETHAPMGQLPPREQRSQLLDQIAALAPYGASFPRLFRPPYGSWDAATLALLHRYRMLMVLWSVDTSDYLRPGVSAIVHSVLAGARPGAIILMHDGGGDRSQTVAALPRIIRALRSRGYTLVTVPRLLLDNPPPHDQDVAAQAGTGG